MYECVGENFNNRESKGRLVEYGESYRYAASKPSSSNVRLAVVRGRSVEKEGKKVEMVQRAKDKQPCYWFEIIGVEPFFSQLEPICRNSI